ncbi:alpha/beta fold hydrolase [Asanoa sp. WMMD1127]|uniref:alpha/beta hydrolase n=1 Tax=Asanoa sp. WMMD1127 TaxID=3016107 RepID=UPI002416FFEF|nr:alpha/beta hydrolase [Asanoa sp. WMMD1127]MDG4826612.1 alpha/beta fold hydrolase [Asanoa sp. WMMD1127]
MRARQPDIQGYVKHDGVRIGYEVFEPGDPDAPTVALLPAWSIIDSRHWKAQVPFLAREFRVVTIDPPGNGRSDRPTDPAAYSDDAHLAYVLAVLDAVGATKAVLVGLSRGGWWSLVATARHPERVIGAVAIAPVGPFLDDLPPHRMRAHFEVVRTDYTGWERFNAHFWRQDLRAFAEFFFHTVISEPHSTKQIEDAVDWAERTTPESLIAAERSERCVRDRAEAEALLRSIDRPVLVIRGSEDHCRSRAEMVRTAQLTGARDVVLDGADHLPHAREPVVVNRLLREFVREVTGVPAPPVRWTRPLDRPRRVLYLSSPIGLGHAERDAAIVDALRRQRPGVQVDWLAQHPVTEVLRRRGERVHPASAHLAAESAHIESEAGEHDLHAFQAVRRMDEILVANFMVFADLVEREHYDLWVGDEAWELDYFLHENPELKRSAYAWLTDFVGWLPMPSGGAAEAELTADYNAEMVEQIARFPRLRDRSVFVGNPDDLVADPLGPGLPSVRDWTLRHFDFSGYVCDFAPVGEQERAAIRAELGWAPGEPVCVATVGGSGVGGDLLRKVVDAFPAARRAVPGLRLVVVAGPRVDPARFTPREGLEVHGYVHRLHRLLAACDLAITHGGLTTTMTLTAHRRPFLYIPLRNHFEQNVHVRHRLAAYRAGRYVDYGQTDDLAALIAEELGRPVDYRPVETDGADRAAALLAELF